MKFLGIDTSAKAASAAVVSDGKLLGEVFVNVGKTHSQTVLPIIQDTLRFSGVSLEELDYLAVSNGPGSFTGLRIGLAAVKGLAYPQNKRCIPVSTLEALAYNLKGFKGILCPVMDARCNQVYTALFESDGREIRRLTGDAGISLEDLDNLLKKYSGEIFLVGDGAELCYNELGWKLNCALTPAHLLYQRGSGVCYAAASKTADAVECGLLVPEYLRLPQAERELKKKTK